MPIAGTDNVVVVVAVGCWAVTPQPTALTVNLDRTANPTVSKVSCDVFTPGISLGAAPRGAESSRVGAGVVDHAFNIILSMK